MLLITGCPRSGTKFIASTLRTAGVRAFHERMGRDGTVNSLYAVDDFWYPGGNQNRPSEFVFVHVFHVVRHPLRCIASMNALDNNRFWHWTQLHTGLRIEEEGRLRYMAKFWCIWNEKVEKLNPSWRFQIESDFWPELCERIGAGTVDASAGISNALVHNPVGWSDLGDLADPVRERAIRYGYAA